MEKKLTNEQLQYLRQCKYKFYIFTLLSIKLIKLDYTMNKYPRWMEVEEIAKRWNIEDFDFNSILMVITNPDSLIFTSFLQFTVFIENFSNFLFLYD